MTHALNSIARAQGAPPVAETVIEVRGLSKFYGKTVIHEQLDLDVRRGEILSLVGGSGSGKTTLLRQILGLETQSSGSIRIFGQEAATMDARTAKLLRSRSGMLFQHGALFSAMTVFDNIAQPLRELGKIPDALLCDIVALKLEMVGLSGRHASKMPAALSGGMVKRVGIARALALEPELLFLDEPTAGLDPQASEEFVELIATLHRALGLTVVMVTHDLDTMVSLSTRVAVLADRRVIAAASVEEVAGVAHPFVENYFLGMRGRRALQALPPERRAKLPPQALEPVPANALDEVHFYTPGSQSDHVPGSQSDHVPGSQPNDGRGAGRPHGNSRSKPGARTATERF
jgi:phospholipid/cholesterol/gamma-HCH transport system ATP-binding protein